MRRKLDWLRALVIGVFCFTVGVGAEHLAAKTYVQDSPPAPFITFAPETILHFWSQQALARGVTNDAQWATAMGLVFSTTTFPGADPTALAFLRSFFTQYVHVGNP